MVICMVRTPLLPFSTAVASSGHLAQVQTLPFTESEMAEKEKQRIK